MIRDAARITGDLIVKFAERKRKQARESLNQAMSSVIFEVEKEGEANWRAEVERVTQGWQPGGELRTACEEADSSQIRLRASSVHAHQRNQKALEAASLVLRVRTFLRREALLAATFTDNARIAVEKTAHELNSRVRELVDTVVDEGNGELELSVDLAARAKILSDKVVDSAAKSQALFKRNLQLAARIAVLRNVEAGSSSLLNGHENECSENLFE
jgi:hypothetical protein